MNKNLPIIIIFLFGTLFLKEFGNLCYAGNAEPTKEQAAKWIKSQPVQFLENKGQMTDMNHKPVPQVLFKAEANGMNLYITETGLTYVFIKAEPRKNLAGFDLQASMMPMNGMNQQREEKQKVSWNRIDMTLKGATIKKENILKEGASKDFKQYFLGHCPDGIFDVHSYQKITIKDIYPNIDWVFYNSTEKGFKYDFIVHPSASAYQIEMVYASLNPLNIDEDGNLKIKTELGMLTENAPVSFLGGKEIHSAFTKTLNKKNDVGGYDAHIKFLIDREYDKNFQDDLVIDPQLVWATVFGGTQLDYSESILSDSNGNIFIVGETFSTDFPVQDIGSFFKGINDGFSSELSISKFGFLDNLIWSTYYGGSGDEYSPSACLDHDGSIFITASTASTDLPLQDAGTFFQDEHALGGYSFEDLAILKFDNFGNRIFVTYYGGTDDDFSFSSFIDKDGNFFVTGYTYSHDFPLQDNGGYYQGSIGGLLYTDIFILKFDNSGNRLWATFYGGANSDYGSAIKLDEFGNIFLVGSTQSSNFLTQDIGAYYQNVFTGSSDAFIIKFDNLGNLIWSTLYGGNEYDVASLLSIDSFNNIFVIGETQSADLPTQDAGTFFQEFYVGEDRDAFILKFDNLGNRLWATYFGGSYDEFANVADISAVDKCGNLFFALSSKSNDLSTQVAADGGYIDSTFNGINNYLYHTFLSKFSNEGILEWGTYVGGDGFETAESLALDINENIYIASQCFFANDTTYPMTDPGNGAYYDGSFNGSLTTLLDGFIQKFKTYPLRTSTSNANCSCSGVASIISNNNCQLAYNYLWSDGQITQTAINLCPGIYSVIVSDSINVIFMDTITIAQDTLFAEITTAKDIYCNNDSIVFSSNISYASLPISYLWSTSPSDTLSSFTSILNESDSIYLTVIDQNNCQAKDSIFVAVVPQQNISSTIDTCICFGESINLSASGAPTYVWSTTDTTQNITVSPETITTYYVFFDDGVCDITIDSTIVCVNPNPSLVASEDTSMAFNSSVMLEAIGDGTFYWTPENSLSCNTCATPIASPLANTLYIVTASNEFGCISKDSVQVELYYYQIIIPNIITPNGDGLNDKFQIVGLPQNASIAILNRWGDELYTSKSYQNNWNTSTDGVYYYVLNMPDGKNYNGSFQVNGN